MKKALVVDIDFGPRKTGRAADAKDFAEAISTNGDGTTNFSVRMYSDVENKATLRTYLIDLFSTKADTVLFYFTGHGVSTVLGSFIVTSDAQKYDEGISMDEILMLANNSPAQQKILILDCCYSGAMGNAGFLGNHYTYMAMGVTSLASSQQDQKSAVEHHHSIFTHLLIEALRGGAANLLGWITTGSLYAYIDQALGPWHQRPVFKTSVDRFNIIRQVNPQVPLQILRNLLVYFPVPDYDFPLDPSFEDQSEAAVAENVAIFKELQKMNSKGLILPVDEEFMYFAAMNGKGCRLTELGKCYWQLAREKRF